MNKKRLILTSVISITLIAILMVSTTYSIFTSTEVDENANVYKTGNLDITYTLSSDNIKLENSTPMSNNLALKITPYQITVTNNGTVPYMFDLILEDTTASDVISYEYIMIQVGKLEPVSLSNCTDNIIREDIIVPANNSAAIDVRIWVSDTIQNTEIGKSFYAKLSIDGLAIYDDSEDINNDILKANTYQLLSSHITSLYLSGDGEDINTGYINGVDGAFAQNRAQSIMVDRTNSYKYYGSNPNNYVMFNDELWRIISVSDVKSTTTDTDTSDNLRVKLIRVDDIGNYSWDVSDSTVNEGYGLNDWTQADLMTELNTLYYNSQSGVCYVDINNQSTTCNFTNRGLNATSRNLIDNAVWYINAIDDDLFVDYYAYDFYTNERTGSATWTGKVGLMYPSDYAYATDFSECTEVPYNWANAYDSCIANNWLRYSNITDYSDWQWTISANDYVNTHVFVVRGNGQLDNEYIDYSSDAYVRPVVYLKSDVIVTGGTGTSTDPYTIA